MNREILLLAESIYATLLKHPYDSWRIQNQNVLVNARILITRLTGETDQEVQKRFESILWDVHALCDMLNRKINAGTLLSEWIDEDHCSMRIIAGTDPSQICNRVAFIEKTPRVRVLPFNDYKNDFRNWMEGPKGKAPEYGHYAPSREWCDKELIKLGYKLP